MTPQARGGLSRRNCVIVEHEFIYDVVGGGTPFAVVNGGYPFPLNPGQGTTFPWLSLQAKQWERYKFNFIRLSYAREVSEYATAGTIGRVMVSVDLDAADAPPSTKTQVLDTDTRLLMHGMPSENFQMTIPGKLLHPTGMPRYVRPGGLPGATDIREYDVGNLWVSTSGVSDATTKLGELHVMYSVELSVPVLQSIATAPINNSVTIFDSAAGTTLLATGVPEAVGLYHTVVNGLGIVWQQTSGVLPAGCYMIDVQFQGHDSAVENFYIIGDVQVGGVSIYPTPIERPQAVSASGGYVSVNIPTWLALNGSQVLTFVITANGTVGTLTATAWVRFVAV